MAERLPHAVVGKPSQRVIEAFCAAADDRDHAALLEYLDKYGAAIIDQKNSEGWTALTLALRWNYADTAALLLAKGAHPDIRNEEGDTALIWAAWRGRTEIAGLLLAAGADVNARNYAGRTALMWAEEHEYGDMVSLLRQGELAQKERREAALRESRMNNLTLRRPKARPFAKNPGKA